jgi:hypothetical protein
MAQHSKWKAGCRTSYLFKSAEGINVGLARRFAGPSGGRRITAYLASRLDARSFIVFSASARQG